MDTTDNNLWEAIIISIFLMFASLAALGGIILSFCYLAPEPSECMSDLSLPMNVVSICFGIIVFIVVMHWSLKRK